MAYNVPLSSLNASDGNVTYTSTAVLRVGAGGNVTVAAGLFESSGQVGIGTSVSAGNTLAVTGNIVVFGSGTTIGGNIFVGNITTGNITAVNINTLPGTNANIALDPDGSGNLFISASTPVQVYNATPSTSTSTGALIVVGGVGIGGKLTVGNVVTGNINTQSGTNQDIVLDPDGSGNIVISSPTQIIVQNTTTSSSTINGALIVAGGVGVSGNIYASNAYITSNVGIGSSDLVNSVIRVYGNNATDVMRIRQDGTGNALVVSDAGNDATPFLINSTGNVGIGTANPRALLHFGNTNAGTATMILDGGVVLAAQRIGAVEYDGNVLYQTDNLTSGRAVIPHSQQFRLQTARAAVGSATVPAAFFGPGANVGVLPNSTYEFEYHLFFTKTTNGTVTFRLEESAAPVNLNATLFISNAVAGGGAVSVTDTASLFNNTAAASAFPATKTLTTALNYYTMVKGIVDTNLTTGGNIFISYLTSAGTVTPLRGSYFKLTRLPTGNIGTFV